MIACLRQFLDRPQALGLFGTVTESWQDIPEVIGEELAAGSTKIFFDAAPRRYQQPFVRACYFTGL